MIKLTRESEECSRMCMERCCFCRKPTPYWYERKDVAVCQECAKVKKVKDIPSKYEWCTAERARMEIEGDRRFGDDY